MVPSRKGTVGTGLAKEDKSSVLTYRGKNIKWSLNLNKVYANHLHLLE